MIQECTQGNYNSISTKDNQWTWYSNKDYPTGESPKQQNIFKGQLEVKGQYAAVWLIINHKSRYKKLPHAMLYVIKGHTLSQVNHMSRVLYSVCSFQNRNGLLF